MNLTSDKQPKDIGWSVEDVRRALNMGMDPLSDTANLDFIRYRLDHPEKPKAPLFLFRPFPNYVEEREVDLKALNNSDFLHYGNRCKRPDMNAHTKVDNQVLLDLLTARFNEWLKEARKKEGNGESILAYSDVLAEMNCDRVKFVGGLPEGYQYVSKPRELKRPFEPKKKDGEVDNDQKPKTRKTTPDKYIYGHPHPAAEPFNSVSSFVLHAYWLIGFCNADACGICECKVCDDAYVYLDVIEH